MQESLRTEVLQRIQRDYAGLKPIKGSKYMRKGKCPACGKPELYTFTDSPWMLICGRGKCGAQYHVKDLYDDLFNDWSERAPATEQQPNATARAYLEFARGFRLELIEGWFSQEHYWSRELGIGSATVRFPLAKGGYWERLIDRPERFGKQKARFKPGESYKGVWWCPPSLNLLEVSELLIVEGIFDAIGLLHHGINAVSMMSSAPFPEQSLRELKQACSEADRPLPTLVWALDNEPVARSLTRKWVTMARAMGFRCEAAQVPQKGKKVDWNDLHQRWAFIDDAEQRAERVATDLDEARYQGALLIADSASEKGLLIYQRNEWREFHFGYDSRLYWWALDLDKYNKAVQALEEDEGNTQSNKEVREKALRLSGSVVEIANCYFEALYFQRNEITDESWYYLRVDFPHGADSVKNTFTATHIAAASEFKKRLLGMAAGAMFTGTGQQLEKIMKQQTYGIKTVETIDFVGYSKEHGCYVFGDVAVKDGQVYEANAEDYFEFGKLRIKTLQKGVAIRPSRDAKAYDSEWFGLLWTCFGAQGVVALTWFFGSLFCEQIRARWQSYLFLEATGEAGAGKTTLLNLLWKLLGREGYEGFDPMKSTKAGRSRLMAQVAGMPVVYLEADRHGDDKAHAKTFEWDELKDFYGGGTLATKGVKTAGNETYEPPFRGAIAITQNAAVVAHEAIMTRIGKLHFLRPTVTPESRAAADRLNALDGSILSHFLLLAIKAEASVLEQFADTFPGHEARLRRLHTHCWSCGAAFEDGNDNAACRHCGNTLRGYIRVERISKNHAQLLALLDCLRQVVPISDTQHSATQRQIVAMALERQGSISADHAAVAEFWEVFDYLEGLDGEGPVVNHSNKPETGEIAINLNEFYERANEHKQKLPDIGLLRDLLKDSRSRKFVDANRAVCSAVRKHQAKRANLTVFKAPTVKCWIFQQP
ncbi:bifunctional DNA primase/helicase [Pseudomonas sp. PA15(2017)]|uniref:toprim domain-containing protein n=1 Tax=Pseudomonas sp. PA15(2017) TaxID=1932111 RepID=UPI0009616882|nr:toprim domain-containing protein [Pseudomonas sp. PA15(2017)]OLU22498.1 bifunctional DNA primase/helicase [Pseudomonas sp. PA15(2017)]